MTATISEVGLKTMKLARERLAYYAHSDHGLSLEQTQNTINLFDAIIDNAELAMQPATPEERWKDNSIQFPRLLAEIMATCELTETMWASLCESMDITSDELSELFDRAQDEWERIKAITCPVNP
jgi:hypothetical protein